MSGYQYYEFTAVDRPLTSRELDALRGLSTRAHITPTSFVNSYQWGNFRGDPRVMVGRYFDAFLYLASWGSRELMLRFPTRLLNLETVQRYCVGGAVSAWRRGDNVIATAVSDDEESGDLEWGGEGVLATILPVRAEILAGDERALYLLWLLSVQTGEVDDEEIEPPVPERLRELTGSQTALAEFLRIDRDLLDIAATAAPRGGAESIDVAGWVERLPSSDRDALLVAWLEGGDPLLRAETLRRARTVPAGRVGVRTAGQLVAAAAARREERERAARERRDAAAADRTRRAELARRERLAGLAAEGEAAWQRVATCIAEKKPAGYDVAVDLLVDLREVTDPIDFASRVERLRREHGRKPSLIQRLTHAGL